MANQGILPLVGIVVVAVLLLGLVYANVTGMLSLSGAEVVDRNTATIVVAALFLLMVPWVYRRMKTS
ncbi:hypothetical protein [Halomarina pelagica]|uniref:hypothetical protein n=1 Tax=Halomarina pelagica TaxID=2961599 RepID=UPI0020C5363E|nr:hypothetical protein [Halomarina sp. BND7]